MTGYIDLHVHSNYSDGKFSLQKINEMATLNNTRVISLTEHYNLSSYYNFKRFSNKKIEVIPGIELSSSLTCYGLSKKHVCHIAAYYPTQKIYSVLDYYEMSRKKCVLKTLQVLKREGINISLSTVKASARNKESIGRYDIAIALFKLGYAKTIESAYGEYFDENSPVFVDREKLYPSELIRKIISCKGVPVLVHPKSLRLNNNDFISFVSELKSFGLCGIETYNPHNTLEMTMFYENICDEYELIKTVGSDFHGRKDEITQIGLGINNNLCISDYSIIKSLKKVKKNLFD